MTNQFAKPIIFPLLDKNSKTFYQFREYAGYGLFIV